MAIRITKKWAMKEFICLSVGYNELFFLLKDNNPSYYTAGVYGWNADIYPILHKGKKYAIVTGYRAFGQIKVPSYIAKRFNREVWNTKDKTPIFHELIDTVLGQNALDDRTAKALDEMTSSQLRYAPTVERQVLEYCPYGKCTMITHNGVIFLRSYDTIVAFYNPAKHLLYIQDLYSSTTRRHLTAFVKEVTPNCDSFVPFKKYVGNSVVNVVTGQVFNIKGDK